MNQYQEMLVKSILRRFAISPAEAKLISLEQEAEAAREKEPKRIRRKYHRLVRRRAKANPLQ